MSPAELLERYANALGRYPDSMLRAMLKRRGQASLAADEPVIAVLADPNPVREDLERASPEERLVFGLLAFSESPIWSAYALAHCLTCLGVDAAGVLNELFDRGWLAADTGAWEHLDPRFPSIVRGGSATVSLLPHPATLATGLVLPQGPAPATIRSVRQIREADGREPALRLAALWQRVVDSPLRSTQSGALYKRDRERLRTDPCLTGPIADALYPLPDPLHLWLELAVSLGLLQTGQRIEAAPASFWTEHGAFFSRKVAICWLSLQTWHERHGSKRGEWNYHFPFLRLAVLLTLARLDEEEWVTLSALTAHFDRLDPKWAEIPPSFDGQFPDRDQQAGTVQVPKRIKSRGSPGDIGALDAFVLGPAYLLGLVRLGEDPASRKPAVQITPFGRFVLGLGGPPPPHPRLEHFLLVQPNFDLIAYRQGLTPEVIGQLTCFAQWKQLGSVLELTLTAESVYRGLETIGNAKEFLAWLAQHSAHPVPASLAEALRTWSGRRERVTYHPSATLIEFATSQALDEALEHWPQTEAATAPIRVTERLLLVEDEATIPFHRFRLTGSRDYRQPLEACVELEADGVTLGVDLGRSDLLIDAELERLAEPLPAAHHAAPMAGTRRRYRVTAASLRNALASGLSISALARWFIDRTGQEMSSALHLLLYCAGPRAGPLVTGRPRVLRTPTAVLLDGLLQHPATRPYLGERLGPTTAIVPEAARERLEEALAALGLSLCEESDSQRPSGDLTARQ